MTSLQAPLTSLYRPLTQGPFGSDQAVPSRELALTREPQSVLIVSADQEFCSAAAEALRNSGFKINEVQEGTRGLAQSLEECYSLVIVDAVLPVLDGLELVHELRTRSTVPVLLVADDEKQCVAACDAGADDFILRSASSNEMLTRLQVVLRKAEKRSHSQASVLTSEDLVVNVKTHEAFVGGQPLSLTNIEFAILKCLIRHAGKIVSRDELAAVLYQRKSTPFERSIDVHISHLRKKIEAAGKSCIRTIRGIGYLLAAAN